MGNPPDAPSPPSPPDPAPQQTAVDGDVAALTAVLAMSNGASDVVIAPGPSGGFFPDASPHVNTVAASSELSGPGKLSLLARLKGQHFNQAQLLPLALSLVVPNLPPDVRNRTAIALIAKVSADAGGDPLGRDPQDYFGPGGAHASTAAAGGPSGSGSTEPPAGDDWPLPALLRNLIGSVVNTVATVKPGCDATVQVIDDKPVLYVQTELYSKTPLDAFANTVNPLKWPDCPVQHTFFRSMVPKSPEVPLAAPDHGWTRVVEETVDFGSMGGTMVTDLNVSYFETQPDATTGASMGCTYDLAKSVDGKIMHDEGYLVVQDLTSLGVRRATSLKAVWFTNPAQNTPASQICPVWSLSSAILSIACLDHSGVKS